MKYGLPRTRKPPGAPRRTLTELAEMLGVTLNDLTGPMSHDPDHPKGVKTRQGTYYEVAPFLRWYRSWKETHK